MITVLKSQQISASQVRLRMQMDKRKNKRGGTALWRIKEHEKENGRGRLEERKQQGERM